VSTNGEPGYTVHFPPDALDRVQAAADAAGRLGLTAEFAPILLDMHTELKYRPTRWGDPLWTVPGSGNTLYRRYHRLLVVGYEVEHVRRVVRVKSVLLPPGSPLAGPDPPA
jgi:hypothetical protein